MHRKYRYCSRLIRVQGGPLKRLFTEKIWENKTSFYERILSLKMKPLHIHCIDIRGHANLTNALQAWVSFEKSV